ncbi:non-ribosomal peptide synthetase [Pseudoalteromonas rubra]|uniref:Non-ribosomal peptide synthetase n=1 Tax=Pseudoalteromonas rubra TaxID=43658 RepID=A0A5S3WRG2_9GAMM|nr:non-ribosomal peptide synthetase [Pseudoalteromonas rubra]TMP30779.1 non-ribosomal peptide synthetase [Pseudoalteromonas rubra]TMP34147.1 non-ribosomal peptide synthetase [Pseudoalteromonas rubra]
MSVELLFQQLQQAGVIFQSQDEKITLKLPKEMDSQLKRQLAENKDALKAFLHQLYARSHKRPTLKKMPVCSAPLSFAQQRLWMLNELHGGSAHYNMPQIYRVEGQLEPALVEQALAQIVQRHQVLRTVYQSQQGKAVQVVRDDVVFSLTCVDLSAQAPDAAQQALDALLQEDAQTPFDLSQDLMIRATWVSMSHTAPGQVGYLLLNMHHIASDGWSMAILSQEFFAIYASLVQGNACPLPALALQYKDYAHWQREWLSEEVLASGLKFWQQTLTDLPALHSLPLSYPRPAQKGYLGARHDASLGAPVAKALTQLCEQHQLSPFMLMHGALALTLSRFSGNSDVVIGTPVANRSDAQLKDLIGFFVNSLVLRASTEHDSLADFLAHIRHVNQQAQSHQDVPFEQIVEALNIERDSAHTPLFQIVLTTNSDYGVASEQAHSVALPELSMTPLSGDESICKFDLEINLSLDEQGVHISWLYDKALFSPALIARFNAQLMAVIERLAGATVSASQPMLSEISALNVTEQAQLAALMTPSELTEAAHQSVTELFSRSVALAPQHIALECGQRQLSYGELDSASSRLARYLIAQGRQAYIGLLLPRGIEMIVAMLAVLKSGATYVPLNPDYPQSRIDHIVADADLNLVITCAEHRPILQNSNIQALELTPALTIEGCDAFMRFGSAQLTEHLPEPENPAYVIYTSGSTGLPKGVAVPHRAISRLVMSPNFMSLDRDTVFLQAANVAFDAATLEIWGPLLNGGCCVIYPQAHLTLETLNQVIEAHRVNAMWLTAGLFSEWSKMSTQAQTQLSSLRTVLAGGDVLDPQAVARVQRALPAVQVVNGYGPTENTTFTCCYPVPAHFDPANAVPIGRALQGDSVMVLSGNELVPLGSVGELCVSGPGLALGYLNLAALSAEKFTANPFYDDAQSDVYRRLYRTGDLVRVQADGVIDYVGRTDNQIKIRGFRVELGEIEQQITQLESVASALVVVNGEANKRLVAYIELTRAARELGALDSTQLSQKLAQRLPGYMVPNALVLIEHWPLTSNGKIDRRALPEPALTEVDAAHTAPVSEAEQVVVDVCGELLERDPAELSTTANFFALGGHSLLMIQLIAALKERGYQVDSQALFTSSTLAQMATQLSEDAEQGFVVPQNRIPPECTEITPELLDLVSLTQDEINEITAQIPGGAKNIQDIYPLAPLQQGILAMHTLSDGRDPYVTTMAFSFSQRALLQLLETQLNALIARHDVLRTAILWRGRTEPVQVVQREAQIAAQWLPVNAGQEVQAVFENYVAHGAHRLELESAPMMQLQAMEDKQSRQIYVVLKVHHLLIDHVSLDILMAELARIESEGAASLPAVTPYRHFIARVLHDQQHHDAQQYFKAQLGDFDQPAYPFGLSEVNGDGGQIDEFKQRIPAELASKVRDYAKSQAMSPAALFHLAWGRVVAACSGQQDVVFGTVLSGRMQGGPEMANMLGMMINTLPVRVTLDLRSAQEALHDVHAALQSLLPHEQAPLSEAMLASGVEGNMPLFSAVLNYRHSHDVGAPDEAADLKLLGVKERTNYPCVMSVDDLGSDFSLTLQIDNKVNGQRINAYLVTALTQLLDALQSDSLQPVAALPVLPDDEQHRYLEQWNDTEQSYAREACVHQLFEQQVAATPGNIALRFEAQTLTYTALNSKANQLAHYLRNTHNIGPDSLVGLCVERSVEMVIGIWGILKAGGAYVPLDPELPAARLNYLVENASADVVLSTRSVANRVELGEAKVVVLDEFDYDAHDERNIAVDEIGLTSQHLAYMIYTSGSTGKPKGVLLEHQALHNRIDWMDKEYGCDISDKILQKTPYSFDVSVWEFVWPMLKGAELVIAKPGGHKDPAYLSELVVATGVTKLHFVPSMLGVMLEQSDLGRCTSIKQVFCSGEALQISHVEQFKASLPTARLHNLYGPTEAAIDVSYWDCAQPYGSSVPIGKPIQNIQLLILDEALNLLPQGACGELHIGGEGLARGYLNRPELTDERFIANPFFDASAANSSQRLYKTGDLVRYREDGNIEYMGRLDHQVKIRGLRIELGEIEFSIGEHSDVDSALVMALTDEHGSQRLVAYVKPLGEYDEQALTTAIRAQLSEALAEYMVPDSFIYVSQWPQTPNGKIDRKALPAPELSALAGGYEAPKGDSEVMLAQVWADVLKLPAEQISRDANFFALGGHSLLVMKLVQNIDQVFKTHGIAINKVVERPTLSAMAQLITDHNDHEWQAIRPVLSLDFDPTVTIYLAPGAGMTSGGYMDLARALPQVQIMSLEPVGMSEQDPVIDSWDELINCYADAIISERNARGAEAEPAVLMGHSSGGAVAFATALKLESLGCKTQLLLCECLVATDDEAQFEISEAEKQELMLSYAKALKPEDSEEQLLSWLSLGMTQRLFTVYFQQVDWSRRYQPEASLNGAVSMIVTPELGATYWQQKQTQLQAYVSTQVETIHTEGKHVTMVKSPYVSGLADKLMALLA